MRRAHKYSWYNFSLQKSLRNDIKYFLVIFCFLIPSVHAEPENKSQCKEIDNNFSTERNFLIIVSNPLYQTGWITDALTIYQQDLLNEGWGSTLITINKNVDPDADYFCPNETDLKDVIKNYYLQGYEGFVIIGSPDDIPTAWWKGKIDGTAVCPTDLYYADMDDWIAKDGYIYMSYDSSGNFVGQNFSPELFYGRITAGVISATQEEEALKVASYLEKIHQYRSIGSNLTSEQQNRTLHIANDGYIIYKEPSVFFKTVANSHVIYDLNLSNPMKLAKELEKGYKFVSVTTHSNPRAHTMEIWEEGEIKSGDFSLALLNSINPKVHYVHLFACSAGRFTEENFAATYIFNNEYTYNVTAPTGPWGFNPDSIFRNELNNGIPIGIALKNYIHRNIANKGEMGWPKGILHGDPLIKYASNITSTPPFLKTTLHAQEATVGQLYELTLEFEDADNDIINIEIENLPQNANFDGRTLSWIPSWDQLGETFVLLVKATDSYNNTFSEEFTIYVSYINNGLLNRGSESTVDGWTTQGDAQFIRDTNIWKFYHPFKIDGQFVISSNSSWGAFQQSINVESYKNYKLICWTKNELIENADKAFIKIEELNVNNDFVCNSTHFFSDTNTTLTLSLHSGDDHNLTSGLMYFTGLRLNKLDDTVATQLTNGNFENGFGNFPDGWTTESWANRTRFQWEDSAGIGGSLCVSITIEQNHDDARWIQDIRLAPETNYKLTGWIKGENIVLKEGNVGANLCIMGTWTHTPSLSGTFNWTKMEVEFTTPSDGEVRIGCRLGYWGSTVEGKAWFDDISISIIDTKVNYVDVELPKTPFLYQNYPNPFNSSTNIRYEIPHDSHIEILLFNLSGKKIKTLYSGRQTAGTHVIVLDSKDLSSGIYFYRIKSNKSILTRKCLLIK
jgi:hypothetical protein